MRAAPEKFIGDEEIDCLPWTAVDFTAWHNLAYHVPVILAGIYV